MTTPPAGSSDGHERVSKENEALRSLVLRQRQDQRARAAAMELIKDELARLDVQSKLLDQQLQVLGGSPVQLSGEEQALFADLPTENIRPTPNATPADTVAAAARATADHLPDSPLETGVPPMIDAPPAASSVASSQPAAGAPEVAFNPPVVADSLPLARAAKDDFDKGRYAQAEKEYEKLLAAEPRNPYLLASRGLVFLRQGNVKEAESAIRRAMALAPKDAFPLATLGIVYFKTQHYDEAIATLTQAIQMDPKNAIAHNYLGITSSQKGWPEAAVDEVQKAIALNPNYAEAHFNLAVIYATSQPPAKDRAEDHYKIATSLGAAPDPALEKLLKN